MVLCGSRQIREAVDGASAYRHVESQRLKDGCTSGRSIKAAHRVVFSGIQRQNRGSGLKAELADECSSSVWKLRVTGRRRSGRQLKTTDPTLEVRPYIDCLSD